MPGEETKLIIFELISLLEVNAAPLESAAQKAGEECPESRVLREDPGERGLLARPEDPGSLEKRGDR